MNKLPPFTPQNSEAIEVDSRPQEMPKIPGHKVLVCEVIDWDVCHKDRILISTLGEFMHAYDEYGHWPADVVKWYFCDAPIFNTAGTGLLAA